MHTDNKRNFNIDNITQDRLKNIQSNLAVPSDASSDGTSSKSRSKIADGLHQNDEGDDFFNLRMSWIIKKIGKSTSDSIKSDNLLDLYGFNSFSENNILKSAVERSGIFLFSIQILVETMHNEKRPKLIIKEELISQMRMK